MAASFPTGVKTWTQVADNTNDVMAADVNTLYDEVTALETELGTDPAGTVTDVKTRLAQALDGAGNLNFAAAATLTISSGAITPTQNWHAVDTQGAASTDDLETISAGSLTDGFVLFLKAANAARAVTVKHASGAGNIRTSAGADFILSGTQVAVAVWDGTNSIWLVTSTAGLAPLGAANTWSAEQSFNAAVRFKYLAVTDNTALSAAHYVVNASASGGAITITLPAASGCAGRVYVIRKSDSSSNAVTVDGNAAETINGAATYALTAQYQVVSIMSDGTGWIVV